MSGYDLFMAFARAAQRCRWRFFPTWTPSRLWETKNTYSPFLVRSDFHVSNQMQLRFDPLPS